MRYIKTLCLVVAAGGIAQAASAADYAAVPYAPPSGPAPIVELGTGWYIRGDIGVGEATQAQFAADLKVAATRPTWTGDLGFGYKLNDFLRTDVTVNYFKPQHLDYSVNKCPSSNAQVPGCGRKSIADLTQANALGNVYADLGTYFGITPYVGAGAGVARIQTKGYSRYFQTNSEFVSGTPDFNRGYGRTSYSLAWAAMGGFAYNITDHAAIDVGYQYVDNGSHASDRGRSGRSNVVKRELTVQQVKVGFRYLID